MPAYFLIISELFLELVSLEVRSRPSAILSRKSSLNSVLCVCVCERGKWPDPNG